MEYYSKIPSDVEATKISRKAARNHITGQEQCLQLIFITIKTSYPEDTFNGMCLL